MFEENAFLNLIKEHSNIPTQPQDNAMHEYQWKTWMCIVCVLRWFFFFISCSFNLGRGKTNKKKCRHQYMCNFFFHSLNRLQLLTQLKENTENSFWKLKEVWGAKINGNFFSIFFDVGRFDVGEYIAMENELKDNETNIIALCH